MSRLLIYATLVMLQTPIVGTVERVIDGDTIRVRMGDRVETVRYIGVDTPESVHPTRGIEPFGLAASALNRTLVEGRQVRLELDVESCDRYGRLLAYVYTDSLFVNAELLRRGYAQLMTVPPNVRHVEAFIRLQREARRSGEGLWAIEAGIQVASFPFQGADSEKASSGDDTIDGDDIIVFITRTGAKYHLAGCHHLKHSRIPIPLSEARNRYEACRICKPPGK